MLNIFAAMAMLERAKMKNSSLSVSQRACKAVEALDSIRAEAPKGEAAGHAARQFDCNRQYVYSALRVRQQSPELFEAVRDGKVSLAEANRELAKQIGILRRQSNRQSNSRTINITYKYEHKYAPVIAENEDIIEISVSKDRYVEEIAALLADKSRVEKLMEKGIRIIRKR